MAKRIVVLGVGISGIGAAVLAKKKGFDVFVSDKGTIMDENKAVLLNNEIEDPKVTIIDFGISGILEPG